MDQISTFQRAVDQTGRIVAGVKPDQLGLPTPCSDWDVRALLNHTIGAVLMFDTAARGGKIDMDRFQQDLVGEDPAAAYDRSAAQLHEAVGGKQGVLEQMWEMPFGTVPGAMAISIATVEALQHGWDVARATGQNAEFEPELTEAGMAIAKMMPAEQVRQPGVFGAEVPCPEDAPPQDRLAAFLGRQL